MEILPIYLEEQMERCKKAGVDPSMIYQLDSSKSKRILDIKWNSIEINYMNGLKGIIPFLRAVEETKLLIEPEMYRHETTIKNNLEKYTNSKLISEVVSRAIRSPSWRERATVMGLVKKMFDGELDKQYITTATAVELVQEAFMLQDDVLDEQERCVNRETIPSLYGISRANLAKDLLLAEAGDILRENLDSKIVIESLGLTEEMIKNDTLGQWIDMESEKRMDMNEKEYFQMIKLTPGTQFQNLTHLSYLLTGRNDRKTIENLREFGRRFGMAAQLRDDIIDIIGDEEVVYKKLGTDVLRRKKRLPLIKYLEENSKDRKLLSQEMTEDNAQRVLENIRRSDSIHYCVNKVRNLVNEGVTYLEELKDCKEKETLMGTANLVSNFDDY